MDFADTAGLADDETRVGALDPNPVPAHRDDLFAFDEAPTPSEAADSEDVPARPGRREAVAIRTHDDRFDDTEPPPRNGGRSVGVAVGTGVGVGVVFLICAKIGAGALAALTGLVLVVGAAELYNTLRRQGYHPATLLGLVATISLAGASYWRGEPAYPLVLALLVVFTMLWYLAGVVRARPAINIAMTLLGFAYVGFLGSFAVLMLKAPHDVLNRNGAHGVGLLLGTVIAAVSYDVGAFFIGRSVGRTPLSPEISPNKSWEGLVGGTGLTLLVCILVVRMIHPWTFGHAFWLAVVVAVAAPLGDLCESLIKRDLGVKDMGSILPGHGGVLDRIDALLFVAPSVYYLVRLMKIG